MSVPRPTTDTYDDVVHEPVTLVAGDGAPVDALCYRPARAGPHPGIVVGMEATGINAFIRNVAATLAHLGAVTIVPDYYRGSGPTNPEDYDDIEGIMGHVYALDFRRAARDLITAADVLRARADVDARRVGVWGYCTGATVALLAACLDRLTAAAVAFYPSQPTFDELGPRRPAHLVDLLWMLPCPTLIVYGDEDVIMPPDLLDDLRARLASWGVDHEVRVYQGAGHAFSAPAEAFHHAEADVASWTDAVAFLRRTLLVPSPS